MSEASKTARAAMKAKAKRLAEATTGKVDASDYDMPTFTGGKQTGKRPLNPREYKRGGKVVEHMSGESPSAQHAGKMSRHPTHGCRIGNKKGNWDDSTNVSGRIAKADGGGIEDVLKKAAPAAIGLAGLGLKSGGRAARKHGGKTSKGKTNINIIIGGSREQAPQQPPQQPGPIHPPGMFPPGMAPGAPPPMAAPPAPSPGAMAGMMPRKSGGRTFKKMDAGAGSGEGRLEKIGKSP